MASLITAPWFWFNQRLLTGLQCTLGLQCPIWTSYWSSVVSSLTDQAYPNACKWSAVHLDTDLISCYIFYTHKLSWKSYVYRTFFKVASCTLFLSQIYFFHFFWSSGCKFYHSFLLKYYSYHIYILKPNTLRAISGQF